MPTEQEENALSLPNQKGKKRLSNLGLNDYRQGVIKKYVTACNYRQGMGGKPTSFIRFFLS